MSKEGLTPTTHPHLHGLNEELGRHRGREGAKECVFVYLVYKFKIIQIGQQQDQGKYYCHSTTM